MNNSKQPPFKVFYSCLNDASWGTRQGAWELFVCAGYRGTTRVVPPAGEDYAFTVTEWARRVAVHVSPTGRSVRVWVDGTEVAR